MWAYDGSIDTVIVKIEDDLKNNLDWFKGNGICANPAKLQVIFLSLKINNSLFFNVDIKQEQNLTRIWG